MFGNNALLGSVNPRNSAAGVYPGSGVAPGGQQGRMGLMHGGLGGGRTGAGLGGGSMPRALSAFKPSSSVAGAITGLAGAAATGAGAFKPPPLARGSVGTAGPVNATHGGNIGSITANLTVGHDAVGPLGGNGHGPYQRPPNHGGGGGKPPNTDPFAQYQDSTYWKGYGDLQDQYHSAFDPLTSELAGLQAKDASGQTIYDRLYAKAHNDFLDSASAARLGEAQQGLLYSGQAEKDVQGLDDSWNKSQTDLMNQYGTVGPDGLPVGRAAAIGIAQGNAQQGLNHGLQGLLWDAYQRALAARGATSGGVFSTMPAPPNPYQPVGA